MDRFLSLFALIIVLSASQHALASDADMNIFTPERTIDSIIEFIPPLETLDCRPKCGGPPICGDFKEINSCLDQGEVYDCFWSCE